MNCNKNQLSNNYSTLTENQKLWLEDLIDEYRATAANEELWAKGAKDSEQAQMHQANAKELTDFADMLAKLYTL